MAFIRVAEYILPMTAFMPFFQGNVFKDCDTVAVTGEDKTSWGWAVPSSGQDGAS